MSEEEKQRGERNMGEAPKPKRMSIAELEEILERDEEVQIEILPNGEVRVHPSGENVGNRRPLTFRENLGGEYALAR